MPKSMESAAWESSTFEVND